jgi:hypothetical protein
MPKEKDFGFEVTCDVCNKPKKIHLLKDKTIENCIKKLNEFKWVANVNEQICSDECKKEWDDFIQELKDSNQSF